jgi:hypothetical protein
MNKSEWRLNKELTDKAFSGCAYISRDWYKDGRKITTETKLITKKELKSC